MERAGNWMRLGVIVVAVMLAAATVWGAEVEGRRGDRLLQLTPAESLFCVRINNLDGALGQATEFLGGIAPDGFDARAMVMAKLSGMVGQERMEQVRQQGNFTMFAVILPNGEGNQGPFANLFMGILVPVKDYAAFVGGDTPEGRGITALEADGRPVAVATRFGRYALLSQPGTDEKLGRVRRLLRDDGVSLGSVLNADERQLATTAPIWFYANVQKASALVKPMVFGKLEQIKGELKQAAERDQMPIANPEGIIRFYAALLDMLTDETASIAVGLTPSAESCRATFALRTVPGTRLAGTMAAVPHASAYKKALGYLHDEAIMNVAVAMDAESWDKSYQLFIDLMPKMLDAGISQADMTELRDLVSQWFGAMGEWASFSFVPGGEGPGMFSMQYVFPVKNAAAMEDAIRKGLLVTNSEAYQKFMENFGIGARAVVESETATYRGVPIHAARLTFEAGDPNSPSAQMLTAMWGGGFDYRWGVTGDYCAYAIGKEADKHVCELIDQIKAGGAEGVCDEMKAALRAIPNSEKADAVGTFNYVRMLNATMGSLPLPDGKKLPSLNVPTEGNVAFAAFSGDDGFAIEIVLPKKHILEIKSAFETIEKEMKNADN